MASKALSIRFKYEDVKDKLKDIYAEYPELLEKIATLLPSNRFRSVSGVADYLALATNGFLHNHPHQKEQVLQLWNKMWRSAEVLLPDHKYRLMAYHKQVDKTAKASKDKK